MDNLLPYACVDEESKMNGAGSAESEGAVRSLVPDGSPLLPNLGRASSNGYILDISVSASVVVMRAWQLLKGAYLRM